jgi:hypothetical protein
MLPAVLDQAAAADRDPWQRTWLAVSLAIVAGLALTDVLHRSAGRAPSTAAALPTVHAACSSASYERCRRGERLIFRLEPSTGSGFLAAFLESGAEGELIWLFPAADDSVPELAAVDHPVILRQSIPLAAFAIGSYRLTMIASARPLSRAEALAATGPEVERTQLTFEVVP